MLSASRRASSIFVYDPCDVFGVGSSSTMYAPPVGISSSSSLVFGSVGMSILVSYLLLGFLGPLLIPRPEPNEAPLLVQPFHENWVSFTEATVLGVKLPIVPEFLYPLGTDSLGQDMIGLLVHATPAMFKMIFAGAVFSTTMATAVGTLSGYKAGTFADRALMTVTDIVMTIPGLPLIIIVSALFEPRDPVVIGLLLTINAWAGLARAIRSQVLSIREEAYVEASRLMGLRTHTVLWHDVLPNIMPYVVVNAANSARRVIFASVGLYFLGILPFTTLNWGVVLNLAYNNGALYTWETAYWIVEPTVVIMLLSLSFILIAQGTDRLFNPRVRAQNSKSTSDTVGDSEEDVDGTARMV